MSLDNVPEELRALPQWINWRTELTPSGRHTKIPYQARKRGLAKASTTNPDTWTTFEQAVNCLESGNMDGVGFVFTADDPYMGIDLDGIDDGDPYGFADLVNEMNTYAEISPSGRGIHLIGRGTLPSAAGKHPPGMGLFDHSRFFTVTGNLLNDLPRPIMPIQHIIDREWPSWFPPQQALAPIPVENPNWWGNDEDILNTIRASRQQSRFDDLWGGNISAYGDDHSAADLALCSIISFYTQDRDQIARIFGNSALAQREKWDSRPDYRELTITKSLQRSEFYTPPSASHSGLTIVRGKSDTGEDMQVFTFNTTDVGNALRVLHHYGDSIRYCHPIKSWMIWDGTRWKEDESGEITRIVMASLNTIYTEAASVSSDELGKALKKWAVASESATRVAAVPKLIQDFRELAVSNDDFDSNPYLLNVANGTINLRDGSFQPHARESMLTKIAPVAWDQYAISPSWLRFLDATFAGDQHLISFLQRALGYSLTGDTSERRMFICYGTGRNGKSTLIETVSHILGQYAATSSAGLVTARKGDTVMPTDLARLMGIRFTSASETGEYSRMDESRVKNITGGDRIVGERKYRDPFEFNPAFKIWLSTNHQPTIRGVDDGIWDRICLIPFSVRIADDQVDRYLRSKLLREAPGILNWLVQGCLDWQTSGLGSTLAVENASSEYRRSMDSIGIFIEECLVFDSKSSIPVSDLYAAYEEWTRHSGEFTLSKRALTNRLRDRGIPIVQAGKRNISTIVGIRMPFPSENTSTTIPGTHFMQA